MPQSARRLKSPLSKARTQFKAAVDVVKYDRQWRKARLEHLRNCPWCVECAKTDRYISATDVDHIEPHRGDKRLFWDRANWQSLCKSCHSKKTASGK